MEISIMVRRACSDHFEMSNAEMCRMFTDGTFVDWMKTNGEYTPEREVMYTEWVRLQMVYRTAEFKVLNQSSGATPG